MSDRAPDDDVFFVVKNRQMQMAVFSVFASPELHELSGNLSAEAIAGCVEEILPILQPLNS